MLVNNFEKLGQDICKHLNENESGVKWETNNTKWKDCVYIQKGPAPSAEGFPPPSVCVKMHYTEKRLRLFPASFPIRKNAFCPNTDETTIESASVNPTVLAKRIKENILPIYIPQYEEEARKKKVEDLQIESTQKQFLRVVDALNKINPGKEVYLSDNWQNDSRYEAKKFYPITDSLLRVDLHMDELHNGEKGKLTLDNITPDLMIKIFKLLKKEEIKKSK